MGNCLSDNGPTPGAPRATPSQARYVHDPRTGPGTGPPERSGQADNNYPAFAPASGTESVLMSKPVPAEGRVRTGDNIAKKTGEVLIISYDLGTTASGCAYMYRDAKGTISFGPESIDQWPGQTQQSQGKTPSVLFYDQYGRCYPQWGAECFGPRFTAARQASLGLQKVEWFKLHIDPDGIPNQHMAGVAHTLPFGVTAWQVYTDYLAKLHGAAIARLQSRRGVDLYTRLRAQDRVQYILTVPAAWQKPAITGELRRCAVRAGLISSEDSMSLDFCSEPEASALECLKAASHLRLTTNDVFTVLDAGGGTVDYTTYQVQQVTPLVLKEVDVAAVRCLYRGSTFVDKSFEAMLREKLQRDHGGYQERHIVKGLEQFVTSTKLQFSNSDRQSTFLQLSDTDEFNHGCIEMQWDEIEQCFKPHVDKIIDAAKAQVDTRAGRSRVVFCSGGFGSNDYLRQRLAQELPGIEILQPGDKSSGSKAVSLGATRYGMFREVGTRTSPAWYGVRAFRAIKSGDASIPDARSHMAISRAGKEILERVFSVVLPLGHSVGDDEWRTSRFDMEIPENAVQHGKSELFLYESSGLLMPDFVDGPNVKQLCKVDVYIPPSSPGRPQISAHGERYRSYAIQVLLSLGRADLRTRVFIDDVECGGASITWSQL